MNNFIVYNGLAMYSAVQNNNNLKIKTQCLKNTISKKKQNRRHYL